MNDSVWLRILIQAIGPLISTVLGTLIIGIFVATIARKAQDRRQDHELRQQLIAEMTTTVSALYLSTQQFWRERGKPRTAVDSGYADTAWLKSNDPQEMVRISEQVKPLHEQYHKTSTEGEAIEARLGALFISNEPKTTFHTAKDLIAVRYFQLVGECTEKLLAKNSIAPVNLHSGLTVDELKDPEKVLKKYHETVEQFPSIVLAARRRKFRT